MSEQDFGNWKVPGNGPGSDEKVADNHIKVTARGKGAEFVDHMRATVLPNSVGIERENAESVLKELRWTFGYGQGKRTAHYSVENVFKLAMCGIFLLSVKSEISDLVIAGKLAKDVIAANLAAAIERQ